MKRFKNIVWSPEKYAEAAVVAREVGEDMLARLDWMTIQPNTILEVGCGLGEASAKLAERFAHAKVLACDTSVEMLAYAKEKSPAAHYIFASADALPLADHSVDLIFANMMLPWHTDLPALLQEWRRVLTQNGLLMLSALGLDTLREWREILLTEHMPCLFDMHDIGDALVQAGFADPVLDVNYLTLTYRDNHSLIDELRAAGMWFPEDAQQVEAVRPQFLSAEDGKWPVTCEIISAHAFTPLASDEYAPTEDGTVRIPLAHLRQKLAILDKS